jgi:hypothetical protein
VSFYGYWFGRVFGNWWGPVENATIRIETSLVNRIYLAVGVNSDVTIGSELAYQVAVSHEGVPTVEIGTMLVNSITVGIVPAPQ